MKANFLALIFKIFKSINGVYMQIYKKRTHIQNLFELKKIFFTM